MFTFEIKVWNNHLCYYFLIFPLLILESLLKYYYLMHPLAVSLFNLIMVFEHEGERRSVGVGGDCSSGKKWAASFASLVSTRFSTESTRPTLEVERAENLLGTTLTGQTHLALDQCHFPNSAWTNETHICSNQKILAKPGEWGPASSSRKKPHNF